MNRDDALRIAKQAGMAGIATTVVCEIPQLHRFADLVIEAECKKQHDKLLAALDMYEQALEGLFIHCLSNGVFNARHQPLDCTALNNAHRAALAAIASVKVGA